MKSDEQELNEFGQFLNDQGFEIDLSDDLWMEDCRFSEHKIRDIFELCQTYATKRVADIVDAVKLRLAKLKEEETPEKDDILLDNKEYD